MKRVKEFIKRETVLTAAFLLAALSMVFVIPDRAYGVYVDYQTIALLFCLMAVMAGFQKLGKMCIRDRDGLNTNICITDTVTNRIVYANENMKRIFGLAEPEGRICWEVLQDGMDGLCPFCRIRRLQAMGGEQSCVWDEMNTLTGWTYKNFDCLIRWEGRDYYVQNSIDVTEDVYKRQEVEEIPVIRESEFRETWDS